MDVRSNRVVRVRGLTASAGSRGAELRVVEVGAGRLGRALAVVEDEADGAATIRTTAMARRMMSAVMAVIMLSLRSCHEWQE